MSAKDQTSSDSSEQAPVEHAVSAIEQQMGSAAIDDLEALNILSNPIISIKMTELRTKTTSAARVRALIGEISLMVGYEASRTLDLQPVQDLETPLGPFTGWKLGQRVGLAPILRAGIAMTDRGHSLTSPQLPLLTVLLVLFAAYPYPYRTPYAVPITPIICHFGSTAMLSLFPEACVFHLGLYRDKVSFTPTEYYSKLPLSFEKHCDIVYLLDPVVATGGTAVAAVNMLLDAGLEMRRIKLLAVIASMPGLQTILRECPGLEIYVAAVDQELTKEGYINPGLGDSGDRIFNTL